MAAMRWLPDTLTRPPVPALRDPNHVDGLEALPTLHVWRESMCVDGRNFAPCSCGFIAEYFHVAPPVCAVEDAETEYAISLWCAEKRITAAKARGERDATVLRLAMEGERR